MTPSPALLLLLLPPLLLGALPPAAAARGESWRPARRPGLRQRRPFPSGPQLCPSARLARACAPPLPAALRSLTSRPKLTGGVSPFTPGAPQRSQGAPQFTCRAPQVTHRVHPQSTLQDPPGYPQGTPSSHQDPHSPLGSPAHPLGPHGALLTRRAPPARPRGLTLAGRVGSGPSSPQDTCLPLRAASHLGFLEGEVFGHSGLS